MGWTGEYRWAISLITTFRAQSGSGGGSAGGRASTKLLLEKNVDAEHLRGGEKISAGSGKEREREGYGLICFISTRQMLGNWIKCTKAP